jgi:D-serine deaminase-like pyridoxal phosphate-dependent protein
MNISEIDTPAVLIEAEKLDRNLRKMADYCSQHRIALRPHTKTHKLPEVARMQMRYGAAGISVAKVGEAEVMADAGLTDIVIVYPVWGDSKWRRVAGLARRVRLSVAMDSLAVAEGISRTAVEAGVEVGIRVEFDTGFGRCGLHVDDSSIRIAKQVQSLANLRWEGISVYPGHIMGDRVTREHDLIPENSQLDRLYSLLSGAGISYPVVSGGNTPSAYLSHRFHGINEIRPGTYVFNDRNTADAEAATYDECAATVIATVVSTSVAGRAIIDAGSKTLTADTLLTGERKHHGYVQGHPELALYDLSEEHGHLNITEGTSIRVGDRLRIVPNHICPCINLQQRVFVVSGEQVVDQWEVAGRGRVN